MSELSLKVEDFEMVINDRISKDREVVIFIDGKDHEPCVNIAIDDEKSIAAIMESFDDAMKLVVCLMGDCRLLQMLDTDLYSGDDKLMQNEIDSGDYSFAFRVTPDYGNIKQVK